MPFTYLRDPLFLLSLALYALNRWGIKPNVTVGFFHTHFNDLICIPFLVPPMLFCARQLGFRSHDQSPQAREIIVPLVVWSILFEVVFPRHAFWGQWAKGDHGDILFYAVGAAAAAWFWDAWYGDGASVASAKASLSGEES